MRTLIASVVFVTTSAFVSAATIYEVNTTGATETGSKNNDGVFIGQSFNSGTNTVLTAATLQINREGLSTGNFTLNLHTTTGSPNNYFKTGSSLASATFSNSILSPSLGTFYAFTNLNWSLTPHTVYMIGIGSESVATVKWTLNQSSTTDSSTGFITGYSGYNAQAGSNVDHGLHGATVSAVPEPAAGMLLLAGVACGGLCRCRRRRAG